MLKSGSRDPGSRGRGRARGGHARGGISKARSPAPRLDRDGDIDMGSGGGRGGGRGSGRGVRGDRSGRGAGPTSAGASQSQDKRRSGRPQRNPFENVSKVQQAIARGLDTGDAVVRNGDRNRKQHREHVIVRGWENSKAAHNPGGCISQLKEFIERKAAKQADGQSIKLTSTKVAGNTFIIHAFPEDADIIVRLNGFSFAGAPLTIEKRDKESTDNRSDAPKETKSNDGENITGSEIKDRMKAILDRRYNAELRLLDLSALGTDPEFANTGVFSNRNRQEKFVMGLMNTAAQQFKTTAQKREAVISISLARNNIPNIEFSSVAQTFPDIINLDLSENEFKSANSLRPWSRRFKNLDVLLLTGNPLESLQPNYKDDIIKWFRTLRTLNGIQVRTEEEAAKSRQKTRVAPVIAPQNFVDPSSVAENFTKHFFPHFDNDRATLVRQFYDSQSTFSLNANTKAPHSDEWKSAPWGDYIKKSRNLIKITTPTARMARKFQGPNEIGKAWLELPTTRHPDLSTDGARYCIECQAVPDVPDPTGQFKGVDGLKLIVHGQFGEINVSTGEITAMRSFDRTFILGPGGGLGGIRVVADIWTIRPYGGYEAWIPTQAAQAIQPNSTPQLGDQAAAQPTVVQPVVAQPVATVQPGAPAIPLPEGFTQPAPGKSEEQLQKEVLTLQLSQATRLTLEYAVMCLETAGWNVEAAMSSFEQVKGTLPANAFI